jgi:NAD(P)-dependent dehydrogenase (short-subunit alcohol dehydrogenase family)
MGAGGMIDLYIITGTSRGLGAALAEQVLAPTTKLLAIARGIHPGLEAAARQRGASLEQWAIDLADAPAAARRLSGWLEQQPRERVGSATLINNAPVVASPGSVEVADDDELSRVLRIDIEAPILLTAAFLRATRGWPAARRVLQVSSGAGRRAFGGSSSYCAAKAALDHFARAVALDELRQGAHGARIVSLAPGVIDTQMQTQMRATDPAVFSERQFFVDMHQRGELATPQAAAARMLAYLARDDFGSQPVADVRDP